MASRQHEILFKRRLIPQAFLHNLAHLDEGVTWVFRWWGHIHGRFCNCSVKYDLDFPFLNTFSMCSHLLFLRIFISGTSGIVQHCFDADILWCYVKPCWIRQKDRFQYASADKYEETHSPHQGGWITGYGVRECMKNYNFYIETT